MQLKTNKYPAGQYYEVTLPHYGKLFFWGEIPEWVETDQGLVHRSVLAQAAGTRRWVQTATGWVLGDDHA